jgi:1-deoxyxylulose-5-phosphate synthase
MAQAKGISNAQVAYAWLLHKRATALIVGASKLPRLEGTVAATEERLSAEEIAALDAAYKPHPGQAIANL